MSAADMARRRERLAREQGGICPWCNLPLPDDLTGTAVEVDHIIPKVRGGPDALWNRQLLHFQCNKTKRFTLTDAAAALAAEHGVVLREPKPYWEYNFDYRYMPAWMRLRKERLLREREQATPDTTRPAHG